MHLGAVAGLASVLLSSSVVSYQVQTPPLDTPWTYEVGTNPWPEHPRPLLHRSQWQTLNGVWKWRSSDGTDGTVVPASGSLTQDVLIPSCLESGISGVQALNQTYSWFTREFTIPDEWVQQDGRVLLNFEAVDYEATIFVNGQQVGHNVGGYWHFTIDVTQFVTFNDTNQL
jgi:beta-galactosidase/beta-glucuronidase